MAITIDGTGTITGVTVGGLPDGVIATAELAAGAVTQAKRSEDLTLGTAQNSTSGTVIDFTGIPSWVKRVTVMFSGVSTSGTSSPMIQLGAGSITISGYASYAFGTAANAVANNNNTSGFILESGSSVSVATAIRYGTITLVAMGSNVWIENGIIGQSQSAISGYSAGGVTLSGTLDRIRITTVNGTDTFDAGTINIMYE